MLFGLVGGLGIFLLGMKNMSDGMQAVAGPSLRRMIGAVTDNRFLATAVGTVVTCVVQSSSITTVMVIGFVNSGVMQLIQGAGVIMGANIGTTITGWILVLKVGKYGLPLLGAAAFGYLFTRSDRIRYWAMALMGVGMVFFGLEVMKDACALIEEMPDFRAWFQKFDAVNHWGVIRCICVGCIMTILVQSSSATLGITISLAFEGVISYPTAAALVLGENVGTTITAFLASLGTTTNARRAAYFHVLFNLVGVCWIVPIFFPYIGMIQWALGGDVGAPSSAGGDTTYPRTTAAIAATHSVFNVLNTLLFLPLMPAVVRMLERAVPGKHFKEKPHLTDLDIRMLESPSLAIEQSRKEILKMGDGCRKMIDWLRALLERDEYDKPLADRLKRREEVLDRMQDEVAAFVTDLLSGNVPHAVAEEAREQLRIAHEYEATGDAIADLFKTDRKLREAGLRFTEKQRTGLFLLHDRLTELLGAVNETMIKQDQAAKTKLLPARKIIRGEIKRLRREHLEDLSTGEVAPQVGMAFLTALSAYGRIRDHCQNVAEAVSREK
ncbi:MAG: Na/Pi cotransporter family protein [Planctomycetaceae bacterium]|nr:Na/Pi cotransporter family protein [Planctomycetaceae bacterium]